MSSYGKILEEAARRSNFKPDVRFFQNIWAAVVPETFARISRPCGWVDGVLHVEVSSSWLDEFEHHSMRLTGRLNAALPWRVKRLEITPGQFEIANSPKAEDTEEPVEIGLELPDLGDPKLNELALAITRHIARAENA